MAVFTEGNLQIAFDNALQVRKFDGDSHGLDHCMKAVDCIVEFDDRYLFIEIKDPQAPNVPKASRERYLERLKHGQLDAILYGKYRDSFLYEWASRPRGQAHLLLCVNSLGFVDQAAALAKNGSFGT